MAKFNIKKVTTLAKQLRAKSGGTWQAAVKKAGAQLRGGTKKKKAVGYATYTRKKMKQVTTVARKKKRASPSLTNRRAVSSVKIGSVASIESHLKHKIADQIGWYEATKMSAKSAKSKREISKKITALKSKYRKLL